MVRFPIVLQVLGWTLVAAFDFAINRAASASDDIAWALYAAALLGAGGFAVSSIAFVVLRRVLPAGGFAAAAVSLASALVAGAIWYVGSGLVDRAVGYPYTEAFATGLFGRGMLLFFIMLAWHVAILAIRASARAADAERLAQEAKLAALRYQLDPHFLFNVLNTTVALIDEDPARAQTVLEMLSALLRQTLDDSATTETTLQRELDVIERYMKIQHVRFEDKLRIDVDVADDARRCAMPPLLLHALVENAVKHGLRTAATMPVEIRLAATYDGDALRIEVSNTGTLAPRGNGVGLRNIADRLGTLYPGRHHFAIAERDHTVRATMEIRSPRVLA
jgi:hypothetical protein